MAIEAPLSKYKRSGLLIYVAVCIAAALWLGYDGYVSKSFIAEHTDEQGTPDSTLVINQKAPPFFIAAAVLIAGYFYAIRNRKLVADENELVIAGKKIPYDSIEKIDKTYFETKGFFTITYTDEKGASVQRKVSDRQFDNLGPILDHLVAQLS